MADNKQSGALSRSIAGDSESYVIPRSQQVLKRAITLSDGQFSLVLVRCNYASLEQAWVERLPKGILRQSLNPSLLQRGV
ncbi:MAG: hypothetical protein AAF889_05490, partial [Cyanobacteria bacterium P01_D01_bin.73]